MPCINSCADVRHFYKNPVTGEFEPMTVIKHVNINIGEHRRRYEEAGYDPVQIAVSVDGLENYEQVKDLVGYVHNLWKETHG